MDIFDLANIDNYDNSNFDEDENYVAYKNSLNKLMDNNLIDTLYYSFLLDWEKKQTICNLNTFINHTKNTDDEFKKNLCLYYNKFLVFDDETKQIRVNKNICYYASKVDTIDFTQEQKKAIKKVFDFAIDSEKTVFGLYGYAGSGKTTTLVEFLSYMLINKYMNSVAFVAPTHKALIVMRTKFKYHLKKISALILNKKLAETFNFDEELDALEEVGVKIKFLTIHGLLCFTQDFSSEGERIFVRDKKKVSLINKFDFIVIDECSMVSIDMIDNIFDEVRHIKTQNITYKILPKIVFSGDPAQLPPVDEENSSIFCKNKEELTFQNYLEIMKFKFNNNSILLQYYNLLIEDLEKLETILLQTVVRSRIDTVTKLCYDIRQWIKNNKQPNLKKFIGQAGVHFFDVSKSTTKINSSWFLKFINNIKNNISSIIVTWTNAQTNTYNETIRKILFKGTELLKFNKDDILILGEFYSLDLGENYVKQKLHTSEQIKVIDVKQLRVPISTFEFKITNTFKKIKQSIKLESLINDLINGLNYEYCKDVDFNCWILKVKKSGLLDEDIAYTMTLVVINDNELEKYKKHKDETNKAIKQFSKLIIDKYKTSQIEKLVIKPLWKQWTKIFIEPFANVNYGYSITCHKAQGSSFYDVYVDLDDILKNRKINEAKKCAYTAITRTSNELNILT